VPLLQAEIEFPLCRTDRAKVKRPRDHIRALESFEKSFFHKVFNLLYQARPSLGITFGDTGERSKTAVRYF